MHINTTITFREEDALPIWAIIIKFTRPLHLLIPDRLSWYFGFIISPFKVQAKFQWTWNVSWKGSVDKKSLEANTKILSAEVKQRDILRNWGLENQKRETFNGLRMTTTKMYRGNYWTRSTRKGTSPRKQRRREEPKPERRTHEKETSSRTRATPLMQSRQRKWVFLWVSTFDF